MTTSINNELINDIGNKLASNELVRRHLPDGSRLHIDRQLPFLCVYRRPLHRDDPGTERLLLGEAAYLLATSRQRHYPKLVSLIREIARRQNDYFGSFLLFELWSAECNEDKTLPFFHIHAPRIGALQRTLEELESELLSITIKDQISKVELSYHDSIFPPGLRPLLDDGIQNYITIGLEINPFFRDAESGELYPFTLRELHHALARVLKRTFYTFTHSHTKKRPKHFHELGRRFMTRVVHTVDENLASISQQFDLLLHVTPVNVTEAREKFFGHSLERLPEFLYRSRPIDPALMKRKLFSIPIEKIEDPTLAYIYEEKRNELDRQLTLISDRSTSRFLSGCRQLFGEVEEELLMLAKNILKEIPAQLSDADDFFTAEQFADIAREEVNYYRSQVPDFNSMVEVRGDISGILISKGNFLIGSDAKIPRLRVAATLAHEIGTHAITYYNGKKQPLSEFFTGMAGYESLQEGLAVLSEYLVGELSHSRLRLLAGRVIAVQSIYQGADFIESFRLLRTQYDFSQHTAFNIAMRVYRGGGYTKDVVYLRGLRNLLSYLGEGGDFQMLLLGKVSHEQLSLIEELQWRKVLTPAVLRPRYLDKPETQHKLEGLRKGVSVLELTSEVT